MVKCGRRAILCAVWALCCCFATEARAQNSLRIPPGIVAFPNSPINVPLWATNSVPVHALSLSIAHDPGIEYAGLDFSLGVVNTILAGGAPDVLSIEYSPGSDELTLGLILQTAPTFPPVEIPVSATEQLLFQFKFDVPSTTNAGIQEILLSDGLGDPPIDNSYSTMGTTVAPTLTSGSLDIQNPNHMRMNDRLVPTNYPFHVDVVIDTAESTQGFAVSVTYDHLVLDFKSITGIGTDAGQYFLQNNPALPACMGDCGIAPGPDMMLGTADDHVLWHEPYQGFAPNPPELGTPISSNRSRSAFGGIFTTPSVLELPAGVWSVVRLHFETKPAAIIGASTLLEFDTVDNFVVIDGFSVNTITSNALLTFSDTLPGFVRGDANVDDSINIADPVAILTYLFGGGPLPICFDAADSNDDGGVDISDSIYLLSFLFAGGPDPLPPYPDCGTDPNIDILDCISYPPC